jgi:hypothetical protein
VGAGGSRMASAMLLWSSTESRMRSTSAITRQAACVGGRDYEVRERAPLELGRTL